MSDSGPTAGPPPFTWEAPAGAAPAPTGPAGDRPMTSGDIFERAMWIYRNGFVLLIAVTAVVQVPLAIIRAVLGQQLADATKPLTDLAGTQPTSEQLQAAFQDALPAIISAAVTLGLLSFVAGLFLSPALIATIGSLHRGEPASVADAYGTALRRLPAIFGGTILIALAILGLNVAIWVVGIGLAATVGGPIILLAVVASILASAYVGIRLALWSQAVVLEGLGPLAALVRSWRLLQGSMWRTFLLLLVAIIATAVAEAILGAIGGILGRGSLGSAASGILDVLTASWVTIVATLLFFDLRARREGPVAAITVAAAPPPEAAWPTAPGAASETPTEPPGPAS